MVLQEDGARGRPGGFGSRPAVFFLCIILISSQLGLICVLLHYHRSQDFRPLWSPPRKGRFLESYPAVMRPKIPSAGTIGRPDQALYADDKRVVRTGPNPLHN